MTVHFMKSSLEEGRIHVEHSACPPELLEFEGEPLLKGWSVLQNLRSTLDAETAKAGWISFFMAGRIEKSSFGIDRPKTLGAALKRLARCVKAENGNSFEIVRVTTQTFLGVFRVTVTAYARRLQDAKESVACLGR